MKQRLAALVSWVDTHVSQPSARSARRAGFHPGRRGPGYLGPVPYILVLRYFIAGAVIIRFWLHKPEYTNVEWWTRVLVFALIALVTAAATYVTFFKPALRRSHVLQALVILTDIGFISLAYWLTNNPESDFFLFYYLPIFAAVEYLDSRAVAAVCGGVGVAMLIVVFSMQPLPHPPWTHAGLVWRVLVPRVFFLLVIVLTSAFVFRGLSRRQTELLTLLESLHSGAAAMPSVQELDEVLESILSELTENLKFEFAAISLVDEYRNCIETVRGRNISPGWIMRAKHDLNVRDIQTHVVNTGETKRIVGWDDLLDKKIYDRFEHWRLARVWAPILSADHQVVGTIEAGCNKEHEDEVLTDSAIERVKQLGREKGEEIARTRPHVLLQVIANRTIELIGADSATLHVYRRNSVARWDGEGQEWGELILAAGAGKATPAFVKFDQPRQSGRGRKAIRTGKPERVDDPGQFEIDYPELHDRGVKALAVVPLKLGPDSEGLLGIHFWQPGKRFTSRELNLAEMFAGEMEGVIQNYLLLRRATEAGGRAWALSGLQSLMQSLASPFHLPDVLKKIARNALLTFDADKVTVYQYHSDSDSFDLPPVTEGEFLNPGSPTVKNSPDEVLFHFIKEGASEFIVNAQDHPVLGAPSKAGERRFIYREGVKSCAVLVLRSADIGGIVGLIFVNFCNIHNFIAEERRAMYALATSAALAIRTARLHTKQLEAMRVVHAAIAEKGPNLKQVLERLLQQTLALTEAKYGVCMRCDEPTEEHTELLRSIARWPRSEDRPVKPQKVGEGIVGLVAKSKQPILIEDVTDDKKSILVETLGEIFPAREYKAVNPDTRSELAVPLLDEGQLFGVLNIEHTEARGLDEDDKALLETLAGPAIIAIHTVDLYERLERRIRHLRALNLIAARVQEKPYELDTILRLFLTGITAGDGLGFSRAMLFLADKDGHTLRGESAIGPVTEQQAQELWERFEKGGSSSEHDLDFILLQAEQFSDKIKEGKVCEYSPLSSAIRQVSFPIDQAAGAAAECLLHGKTITMAYGQGDPFRKVLGRLTQPDYVLHAFLAVPLAGKHMGRIGVLLVDNRFLWKERAIDQEDIAGLEAFAGLLALSIENARLQQRVTEEQRLENWKDVTADIAHTVGTRISAIKGTVTRLRSLVEVPAMGDATKEMQALLARLSHGISKAETVLQEFRTYAVPVPFQTKHVDLRSIVREILQDVHESYQIISELPDDPLLVAVDSFKLGNALMEIIKNAYEAMLGMTHRANLIWIRMETEQPIPTSQKYARIDITDNGPGISAEVKGKLFEPFITTKNGTGLGLAIANGVVERHGGTIEADNCPDRGARFIIRLPMLDGPLDRN